MGVLARWFRFQPSEIDALDVEDFFSWLRQAEQQAKEMNKRD